jgi:hypothetical protein
MKLCKCFGIEEFVTYLCSPDVHAWDVNTARENNYRLPGFACRVQFRVIEVGIPKSSVRLNDRIVKISHNYVM